MTQHRHTEHVDGCHRCELSRDEQSHHCSFADYDTDRYLFRLVCSCQWEPDQTLMEMEDMVNALIDHVLEHN